MTKTVDVVVGTHYSEKTTAVRAKVFTTSSGFVGCTITKRQMQAAAQRMAMAGGDSVRVHREPAGFCNIAEMQSGDWLGQQERAA